jgi:hypothetical protein
LGKLNGPFLSGIVTGETSIWDSTNSSVYSKLEYGSPPKVTAPITLPHNTTLAVVIAAIHPMSIY